MPTRFLAETNRLLPSLQDSVLVDPALDVHVSPDQSDRPSADAPLCPCARTLFRSALSPAPGVSRSLSCRRGSPVLLASVDFRQRERKKRQKINKFY